MANCGIQKLKWLKEPYPVQQSVQTTQLIEISCETTLPSSDADDCLKFKIAESTLDCVDLSHIYAYLEIQILNLDGTQVPQSEVVIPCNMFGYALFSCVQLKLNDEPVTFNQKHYPWMCYILNMLHLSAEQRKQVLSGCLYELDTAYGFDTLDESNKGGVDRFAYTQMSQKTELYFPVILDAHFTPKYLPPKTKLEFEFNRTPSSLSLLHVKDKKYKIQMNEFKLYVAKSRLTKQALEHQDKLLKTGDVVLPGLRYRCNTLSVNKGLQNIDWTVFEGKLPRRVYFWSISQEAYTGVSDKNLFYLEFPDINNFTVFMNDDRLPCNVGLPCKSKNNLRLFYNTLYALNFRLDNLGFDRMDFDGGYKFFCIDLSRDHSSDCNYISNPADGQVRLVIDFMKELEQAIVVFAMGEYAAELCISSNKEVKWKSM